MGNALSGILAEIYLNEALNQVIGKMPYGSLEFIFIFMDDLLYGVQKEQKDNLTDNVYQVSGIKLKSTEEDAKNSVNYLNMECVRNVLDNKIEFKWWQKPESAKKILDYHSFHPMHMKINVISEFLMNALRLTSKQYWQEIITSVGDVLSNSNYPNRMIKETISGACKKLGTIEVISSIGEVDFDAIETYNLMTPPAFPQVINPQICSPQQRSKQTIRRYLTVPHHPNLTSGIKSLVNKLGIKDLKIAKQMSMRNRSHIYANVKDKRMSSGIMNASFKIRCSYCSFVWGCKTNNLDVGRTASHYLNNEFSLPHRHAVENESHR